LKRTFFIVAGFFNKKNLLDARIFSLKGEDKEKDFKTSNRFDVFFLKVSK